MVQFSPILFNDLLGDAEFPSFKEFSSCIVSKREQFSIVDGIIILGAWVDNKEVNFEKSDLNAERISRAVTQTERMMNRENAGLLGKTVSRPKDPNKKHRKKVQSVWTVKKR